MTITSDLQAGERSDFVEVLAAHRKFLRQTVTGLTDEQSRRRTTESALCLGGIIKHVAMMEVRWAEFIEKGPAVIGGMSEETMRAHAASFVPEEQETLEVLLARYEEVAARTEELIARLPSLDVTQPLPEAPWFPPDARWSARRVLAHILAETAQHAGHTDIIRESMDGARTMG